MSNQISFYVAESENHLKSALQNARLYQKPRIKMLILIVQGIYSTQELAKKTKCNRDSIRKWKNLYCANGFDALLADERGGKTFGALTEEDNKKINRKLSHPDTQFLTYKELANWINDTFELKLTYSNLNAYIKRHFATKFKPGRKKKLKRAA